LAAGDLHIAAVLIGRQTIRAESRQMKGRERPLGTSLIPILRLEKDRNFENFGARGIFEFWRPLTLPPIEFVPFELSGKNNFFSRKSIAVGCLPESAHLTSFGPNAAAFR
jgi:hypothetical protein